MPDKPSYLGLLNAVSNAETRAYCYLSAWAEVTTDPDVRAVLLTVAAREGEHGLAFAKRINELGFELQPTDDPGFEDRMAVASSRDKTDLEKLDAIGLLNYCPAEGEPDVFDNFFSDHSIDIQTGELLGRYIAEERDTLRLVSGCASILKSRVNGSAGTDQLAGLENKVDAVCRAVEELRQIVCRAGDAGGNRVAHLATINVEPLSGALGAVASGVDLRAPSDTDIRAIHRALLGHGVLFFRDQALTDDEHLALATRFGEPAIFPIAERFVGGGNPLGSIIDTAESPPDADGWHTDITWIEDPPKMAFLQAISIPERGGDTMWADLYAAYRALSAPMQALCRRLSVVHTVSPVIVDAFRARAGDDLADKVAVEFPPVVHPLVRTHPETGRDALFVSGAFMTGIDGMHDDESAAFLAFLNRHIENPNFHVRWSWQPGDLAIWDERCTNHRALSDHYPQYRQMRRCTVKGDRPVLETRKTA